MDIWIWFFDKVSIIFLYSLYINKMASAVFFGGDHANVLYYIPGALLVGRQASTKGGVS